MGFSRYAKQAKRFLAFICGIAVMIGCESNQQKFDVQGHRGCRGLMPENTIPAFLKAVDLGVTTIELDVVMSGDGEVIVSHEAILNPAICLNPQGARISPSEVYNLYQMSYESIAKCDCGSLGHPDFPDQSKMAVSKPRLVDAIRAVVKHCQSKEIEVPNFNVEIKAQAKYVFLYHPAISVFADEVVAVLEQELPPHKYMIQSFDVLTLQYVHQTHPQIELAFLVEGEERLTDENLNIYLEKLGFVPDVFSCQFEMLSSDVVKYIHERDMRVVPWTVNEEESMRLLINMQVDGLITDYPDKLHAVVTNVR